MYGGFAACGNPPFEMMFVIVPFGVTILFWIWRFAA
jgi:hypothetical protein